MTDSEPLAGSRPIGPDAPTLGGLPEAALEHRRAKRESGAQPTERPTQPIAAVPAPHPHGDPAPPSRELALSIAHGYTAGHVPAGRAASEAMARFIRAQPDYVAAIRAMAHAELVAQRAVDAGDPAELRRALGAYADAKYSLVMLADVPSPLGDLSGAFQGMIDEWVLGTVVVGRMRRRSEAPPVVALDRVDNAERDLGRVSALDDRFRAELEATIAGRRLADVLQLDAPTPDNVTDNEILTLARSCRDGSGTDADARATCIVALGICPPIPRMKAMLRGATREEVIAQARAWCVAKIHERAQAYRLGAGSVVDAMTAIIDSANPDPIDGPDRYRRAGTFVEGGHTFIIAPTGDTGIHTGRQRWHVQCRTCSSLVHEGTTSAHAVIERHLRDKSCDSCPHPAPAEPDRNRTRRAREQAGLSLGQAAKHLGMSRNELDIIEASDDLGRHAHACDFEADVGRMADLYGVSQEWILGYVPLRDYARVDAMRGSDKLTPSDRDGLAEFTASLPRNGKKARERLADVSARRTDTIVEIDAADPAAPLYRCAGPACPGLPYRASDRAHPAACTHPAARFFTPRDDGSCAVCGEPCEEHRIACPSPAVAP